MSYNQDLGCGSPLLSLFQLKAAALGVLLHQVRGMGWEGGGGMGLPSVSSTTGMATPGCSPLGSMIFSGVYTDLMRTGANSLAGLNPAA